MSKNHKSIRPIAWGLFSIIWGVFCAMGAFLWISDGIESIRTNEVII